MGLGTNIFSLRYKHSISIELKNGARNLKEHPKKPKGMVHLVWIGGTGVLQSIPSSLILKVYHAFAFKPLTIKFGKSTNFWMLFQTTSSIFNSIDIEYSYQEKYVRTQSPARLEHGQCYFLLLQVYCLSSSLKEVFLARHAIFCFDHNSRT